MLNDSDHFIATNASDWHLNARVGQQASYVDEMFIYSEGYHLAAGCLVKDIIADNSVLTVDFLIYPIVFLYRHYLELQLKDILSMAHGLLSHCDDSIEGHNLGTLWKTAQPLIDQCYETAGWGAADKSQYKIVSSLIQEFSDLDPNGEAARYPRRKDGATLHFEHLPNINIRHFADVAARLGDSLQLYLDAIKYANELRLEGEAEMMWRYGP